MLQSKWASPAADTAVAPACDDIDPFAQTASTDDLFFDDDVTPINASVVQIQPEPTSASTPRELQGATPEFVPKLSHANSPPQAPRALGAVERAGRGRGRSRGRARGRGGGGRGIGSDMRLEEQKGPQPQAAMATPPPAPAASTPTKNAPAESATTPKSAESKEKTTHSVRGDRTLTGGAARTRLTEAQLNAKLENMRSKNEALQTAHARAEADQAHFEAREAVLKRKDQERNKAQAERQKAERQNRQQMMGEREKNRLRKLNAQGGREWDHDKDDGFVGIGHDRVRGATTRGAYGGIASSRLSAEASPHGSIEKHGIPYSHQRGRGRSHGARSIGSSGSRADYYPAVVGVAGQPETKTKNPNQNQNQAVQRAPSAADFPQLPPTTTPTMSKDVQTPKTLELPHRSKIADPKDPKGGSTNGTKDMKDTKDTKDTKETRKTNNTPPRPPPKHTTSTTTTTTYSSKQAAESLLDLPLPLEKGQSWADEVNS